MAIIDDYADTTDTADTADTTDTTDTITNYKIHILLKKFKQSLIKNGWN